MFILRQTGRTRITTPPVITPESRNISITSSPIPSKIFEQTTAKVVDAINVRVAVFDAGAGNQFVIDGFALARITRAGNSQLSYAVTDAAAPSGASTTVDINNTGTFAHIMPEIQTGRYLHLTLRNFTAAFMWIGLWLKVPLGIAPPFVMPNQSAGFASVELNNRSGQILGARAQQQPTKTTLSFQNYSTVWLREFEATRIHLAKGLPCFLMPDVNTPGNVGVIQAAGEVPAVQHKTPTIADLNIPIQHIP